MFLLQGEFLKNILANDWDKLNPDIKARFSTVGRERTRVFKGELFRMHSSWFGKFLAYLTLPLLKGALVPFTEVNLPMEFKMRSKPGCSFYEKQRLYHFTNRKLICFKSTMHTDKHGKAWEAVGKGVGMSLLFSVENGDLNIDSDGYFWGFAGIRVPIPAWFTPGTMFLKHINESEDQFRIQITIVHSLFGVTFNQEGRFKQVPDQLVEKANNNDVTTRYAI